MSLSNIAEQLSYLHLNTLEVKHYEIQSRQSIFSVYEFSGGIYRTERDLSDYMSADFYHRPALTALYTVILKEARKEGRIHFLHLLQSIQRKFPPVCCGVSDSAGSGTCVSF